jgi:hypothetical protein
MIHFAKTGVWFSQTNHPILKIGGANSPGIDSRATGSGLMHTWPRSLFHLAYPYQRWIATFRNSAD